MSTTRPLRIGTRGSALALWQANRVAELIGRQAGAPPVELVRIRTEGDARTDVPLWQTGGRAFFTREIDRAVLSGEVDLAVHSLKDLATALDEGLVLSAVLEREDPRDALLVRPALSEEAARGAAARPSDAGAGRSGTGRGATGPAGGDASPLAVLPHGARVGTSSLRRRAFLARARPDFRILELRGNVPTRIERLAEGRFDAIVLAAAGVKRLGLAHHVTAYLPPREFTPAVSQGAIGVVSRGGDAQTARWLTALDHAPTRLETLAERTLLRRVEGGCQVPLGALGRVDGGRLTLQACVCALDGSEAILADGAAALDDGGDSALGDDGASALDDRGAATPDDAAERRRERAVLLGERLAEDLLRRGARRIIAQQRAPAAVEPP